MARSKQKDSIPESLWEQIKSGNKEPWRDALMVILRGHEKNQKQQRLRVHQANKTKPQEPR